MYRIVSTLLTISLISCSSAKTNGSVSQELANPCATRGATYLEIVSELSGNCGPIPETILNINQDGTITSPTPIVCASVSQNGCTARDTDCVFSSQGYIFSMTFETTFSEDGSYASSIVTLSGTGNGQSCTETYSSTMTRQ